MLNREQRLAIYGLLDAESNKAAKAYAKAVIVYNNAFSEYEREETAVVLSLREAQARAAYNEARAYFENYLSD